MRKGAVSVGVERIDAVAHLAGGSDRSLAFVRKWVQPWSGEARALKLLQAAGLPSDSVPELILDGEEAGGRWVITPFYEGSPPGQEDDMPGQVCETLARVHAAYHQRVDLLRDLPAVDLDFWRYLCLEWSLKALVDHGSRMQEAERIGDALRSWAAEPAVGQALEILPVTLVHRDMHAGNVLARGSDATIIDWDNAYSGPPLTDLAAITSPTRPGFQAYVTLWAELTGTGRSAMRDDVGWPLAELQLVATYLAVPLSSGDEATALGLLRRGLAAAEALRARFDNKAG